MASVYINSEQITSIANSLKSKGEQILNQYKGDCASALQMSSQCLQLSGLDMDQIFKSMENVYTKLNDRVAGLADFLINTIAAEYDVLSQSITNSFNNDFANEFGALIGVGVGNGGGTSIGTPIKSPSELVGNSVLKPIDNENRLSITEALNKQKKFDEGTLIGKEVLLENKLDVAEPIADATIQPIKRESIVNSITDSTFQPVSNISKISYGFPGFIEGSSSRYAQVSDSTLSNLSTTAVS